MTQSTTQYAEAISDSIINGQHAQAVSQWANAIFDACDEKALMDEIADIIGNRAALSFAVRLIKNN